MVVVVSPGHMSPVSCISARRQKYPTLPPELADISIEKMRGKILTESPRLQD